MGIQVIGLDVAIKGMRNAPALQRALGDELHKAVPSSSAGTMRGRASSMGTMEGRAAGGVSVSPLADGVRMKAGGDPFLMGSEFGGRRRPRRPHVVHSPTGTAYVVRKRTTMNFQPNLGSHGYFITPVWKARLQGIRAKLGNRIAKEVSGG